VVVIERFARELAVFAGSCGGLGGEECVGGCEMADADEFEASDALLRSEFGERALCLVALGEQPWGEKSVDSAVAGTLNATTPLFTIALALSTRTEAAVSATRAAGLVLGFIGAILIVAPWRSLGGSTTGALACLAAAGSYAISYVYMRRYLIGLGFSPLVLATAQIAVGALMLAAAGPLLARQTVDLTTPVVASVIALGGLGTGVAYILNYRLIQDEGATIASTVTYLLPLVAVILGVVVLSEAITWNLYVGTAVVLAGVALSDTRRQ